MIDALLNLSEIRLPLTSLKWVKKKNGRSIREGIEQTLIKWLFYTKLSERRNKIANSYALCEHKVPLAKVGKEIVKEMGLEKVLEIAVALDGWGNMKGNDTFQTAATTTQAEFGA